MVATVLLAAGCGSTEAAALKPLKLDVPSDLCATLPTALRQGLIVTSDADDTGDPTAACSLRSPDVAKTKVHGVVTLVQTNDDGTAAGMLDSQCRAIDRTQFREQAGFRATGADRACAATSKIGGVDSAILAASSGRAVVTVRLRSQSPGAASALARGQQMLEGVIGAVAGS